MAERKQYKIIGKRGTPRRYGRTKAAGTAIYTRDVRRPGMLFAKAMRNPLTLMPASRAWIPARLKLIQAYAESSMMTLK